MSTSFSSKSRDNGSTESRRTAGPGQFIEHESAALETHNNMHTQSVRRGLRVQAKLEISQPQDADELEADRTAELVMRMPDRESKGSDSIYFAFVHYGECVGFINQVIDASYSNWGKS